MLFLLIHAKLILQLCENYHRDVGDKMRFYQALSQSKIIEVFVNVVVLALMEIFMNQFIDWRSKRMLSNTTKCHAMRFDLISERFISLK